MTTEMGEPASSPAIGLDDGGGASAPSAAAATAALSSPVAYFRDALPSPLLTALRGDAEGLACCSNFWVPLSVLSGEEPALAAFEQAAAALAQRCLRRRRRRRRRKGAKAEAKEKAEEEEEAEDSPPPLHPLLSVFRRGASGGEEREEEEREEEEEEEDELVVSGAECWCQLYEEGRGLDPHYDKDEEASARGERPLRHPRVSTVVYLNGGEGDGGSGGGGRRGGLGTPLGATVVVNQRLHPRSGAPLPAAPTSSSLLWPRKGAAAAFDGRLAHCVLSSCAGASFAAAAAAEEGEEPEGTTSSPFDEGRRATVLFNFWCGAAPGGVFRVTEEDIVAAGLSRPVVVSAADEAEGPGGEAGDGDGGGDGGGGRGPTLVPPAAVAVPRAAKLCLLDELLRPREMLDHPFVVVSHPGYELVEAEVVQEDGDGGRQQQEEGKEGEGGGEEPAGWREAAAAAAEAKGKRPPSSRPQVVFIPLSDSGSDSA